MKKNKKNTKHVYFTNFKKDDNLVLSRRVKDLFNYTYSMQNYVFRGSYELMDRVSYLRRRSKYQHKLRFIISEYRNIVVTIQTKFV